ncbi:hypothetical protein SAY87_031785 [Trapa incisa]|uniref:Uncharacterized protein n=1 Tax=Trapa incisa TaxID=236973 RepID=A0AAN7KL59_9MYRT|nr:hypothetical protein SAY87_031785 [Trapa incisa]
MEDEKKKKRKKKKNKQNNKVAEDTAVAINGEGGAASVDHQNHLNNGQNHDNKVDGPAIDTDEVKTNLHQEDDAESLNASLKESIEHLRSEHDLLLQKEADLKINLVQLQSEKESWLHKEESLEEKISFLSDDKASLELKQKSLDEKIIQLERDYDSWILKEKSNKETISIMEMELTKLRLQVEGLEESKNVSIQENQSLTDVISGLQAQIQTLESNNISISQTLDEQRKHSSECDVLNSQLEGACALVEKLITENSELVEKVNELYLELDKQKANSRHSSPGTYDSSLERDGTTDIADRHSISSKNLLVLAEKAETPSEIVIAQDEPFHSDTRDAYHSIVISNTLKSDVSGEIVQIPLDESDVQTSEVHGGGEESTVAVPLSDAPLIGAPFRFISFVAGYVSGADLVDKNSTFSK